MYPHIKNSPISPKLFSGFFQLNSLESILKTQLFKSLRSSGVFGSSLYNQPLTVYIYIYITNTRNTCMQQALALSRSVAKPARQFGHAMQIFS